jgi:hypothetical protein
VQGSAPAHPHCKVPQGSGDPGWLILMPRQAYYCARFETAQPKPIRAVCDERIMETTIFRTEKEGKTLRIADIWMWNGFPVFKEWSFGHRWEFLQTVFPMVWTSCPVFEDFHVELRTEESLKGKIRGYELYTDAPAYKGVFVEKEGTTCQIERTDIRDVYRVLYAGENRGYLRVPTMKQSHWLYKQGSSFLLDCTDCGDGTWTLAS